MKEKLIELIKKCSPCPDDRDPFGEYCESCKYFESKDCDYERLADGMIANGVRLEAKQATSEKASEENKRWIPVTERLPEVGDRCLCYIKSFAFPGSYYISILRYDKYGFVEGCIYTDDVTHWMPLPEEPQEK